MGLLPHRIEILIEDLTGRLRFAPSGVSFGRHERHDWRPVWDLCKQIQEEFRGCTDFPTREAHEAAWRRFHELRQRASEMAAGETESIRHQSTEIRDRILGDVRTCRWNRVNDMVFFFDPTTIEDMKRMGARLKDVGRALSENKTFMLGEHKRECFEAIQEARESQDAFWAQRKELSEDRKRATEQRRESAAARHQAWEAKTRSNLTRNREKLEKAIDARKRARDRIQEIKEKLADATSEKWRDIFSGWLSDASEKLESIEESIDRIENWIHEDEGRLRG